MPDVGRGMTPKGPPGPVRSESGFSLIEATVAASVMLVGIFGVMSVMPESLRSTKQSGRISVLAQLASEKLEQLRAEDLASTDLTIGVHPTSATDSSGRYYYPVPSFPEEYSLRWTVSAGPSDGAGTAAAGMRTVRIQASYSIRYTSGGQAIYDANSREVWAESFFIE
ncbi:MAG: hypothetical protein GY716_15605 [bacterium]|nr:hypothetical protein [bacterium]